MRRFTILLFLIVSCIFIRTKLNFQGSDGNSINLFTRLFVSQDYGGFIKTKFSFRWPDEDFRYTFRNVSLCPSPGRLSLVQQLKAVTHLPEQDDRRDTQCIIQGGLAGGVKIFSDEERQVHPERSNLIPARIKYEFNLISLLRGLLGITVLIFFTFLLSENKKSISWRIASIGLIIQILLAFGILQVSFIQSFFEFGGKVFVKILDFTNEGTEFLFKSLSSGKIEPPLQTFAIKILPTIIFFSAITSVLFYFGIIQKLVWLLAWLMSRFLKISGAESLCLAGNIFVGMSEAPLMIKAYLEKMNRSEMMLVMSGGMATMAGGVLAVYINFLGGDDPVQRLQFAKHLLAASVMAAPGVVVISKIMIPQTDAVNKEIRIDKKKAGQNILDALSNGTRDGVRLAVNVAAMLLVFLASLAMINYLFLKFGNRVNLNPWIAEISDGRYNQLSLQFLLGYALSPLMWFLGVATHDITLLGSLLGEKIIMTEFVGYISLANYKAAGMFTDPKSVVMAAYVLCGFANFASVGILIGALGTLAPNQKVLISELGIKSLIAGSLASLVSATIVGVIYG